jgi:hypothetical protein
VRKSVKSVVGVLVGMTDAQTPTEKKSNDKPTAEVLLAVLLIIVVAGFTAVSNKNII